MSWRAWIATWTRSSRPPETPDGPRDRGHPTPLSTQLLPLWVGAGGLPPGPGTDTFLLLHGYGASSFSWRTWTPFLAERGHVLTVDLKGFGQAPKPADGRYAPSDQAELVLRLVRERDLARITLVGHSLGGGVALYVALGLRDAGEHQRLHRLVVLAGAAYRQPLPPFVALARHPRLSALALRALGPETVIAQALRAMVFDPSGITRDQIRGYAAPMRQPGSLQALRASALQIIPPDLDQLTSRYGEIDVPALLLWGRQDRAVPPWVGQRLAGALPRGDLRVLERCGHMLAEERPEESLEALRSFLDAHALRR